MSATSVYFLALSFGSVIELASNSFANTNYSFSYISYLFAYIA